VDKYVLENWQKIRKHFESLEPEARDNWFYKRAIKLTDGKEDPLPEPPEI
jgi:hypothetical protein